MTTGFQQADVRVADLLSLILVHLDHDELYSADAGRWAQVLSNLREQFGKAQPHLFRQVSVRTRAGARPYSRDVSEFLTWLQVGSVVEVGNPSYAALRIRPEAQAQLSEHHESREDLKHVIEPARDFARWIMDSGELQAEEVIDGGSSAKS